MSFKKVQDLGESLDRQIFLAPVSEGWLFKNADGVQFGMEATILRGDHPDWLAWKRDNAGDGRLAKLFTQAGRRVQSGAVKNGVRHKKRNKSQEVEVDVEAIWKEATKLAGGEEKLEKLQKEDWDTLRPGIAKVLVVELAMVAIEDPENRVTLPLEEIEEILSSKQWLPLGEYGGGKTFGDAVVAWLLDESEEAEAFRSTWVVKAHEDLNDSPSGTSGTGQASSSPTESAS